MTVRIGGTHTQRKVVVILPSVARPIFAPPQNVGVGFRFPRSTRSVTTAREFERHASVKALVHAVESSAFLRLACRQNHHAIGIGRGHSNFATTLIVTRFNGRPTFCDGLKRHPAVDRPFEGRGLVQLLDGITDVGIQGMKRQFHVLAAGHLCHRCAAIVASEKSVVRRSKQHRFFTIDGRSEHQVTIPPVHGLE